AGCGHAGSPGASRSTPRTAQVTAFRPGGPGRSTTAAANRHNSLRCVDVVTPSPYGLGKRLPSGRTTARCSPFDAPEVPDMPRSALITTLVATMSAVALPAAGLSLGAEPASGLTSSATTPPVSAQQAEFDALVFSKTTNFYHDSIPAGVAAIEALGAEHGFNVVASDDSAMFTDESLAEFEVVIFNNTNSTPAAGNLLDDDQRAAFQRYIRNGGGFVGIHSASGTERDWDWYGQLVGA